jgi:hypothetical protein
MGFYATEKLGLNISPPLDSTQRPQPRALASSW